MNWFFRLTIRTKLLIPISCICILMIIMGGTAIQRFSLIDKNITALRETNLQAVSYLLEADSDLHKALVEERSLLFLNANSADFKAAVNRHQSNIDNAHNKLKNFHSLISDPSLDALYADYETAREQWEKLTLTVSSERQADTRIGRTTAMEISFKDANKAFISMRGIIYELKNQVDHKATVTADESQSLARSSRTLIIGITAITLAISLIIWLFIPYLMIEPIKRMMNYIQSLANEGGDLTNQISITYRDELGNLGLSINTFITSLRELLKRVIDMGLLFHQQAHTLQQLVTHTTQLSTKQAYEVDSISEVITELMSSNKIVVDLATEAVKKTQQVRSYSKEGLDVVGTTVNSINFLANEVKKSSTVIVQLNKNSGNIASVVNVIKGIAEQINLLALNAAIEAARAGEQGRGFAVVADSVRELAFKTAESTKEIQSMILTLQESATQAVSVMEKSQNIAEDSVNQAELAGKALEKIECAVVEMSDFNLKISNAADEQTKVSSHITSSIINVAQYTKDTTQLTNNVDTSAQQLAHIANKLHQELGKFTV